MRKITFLIVVIIAFIATNFVAADTIEVDPATPLDSYISLGEWETPGDVDGFTQDNDISNLTVAGGVISGTVNGNDPWIRKDYAVDAGRFNLPVGSVIDIRIKYDADASLTNDPGNFGYYYFNDGNWHAIPFITGAQIQIDGQFHVYRLTTSIDNNFTWIMRVDMFPAGFSGQSFEIDYIRASLPAMIDPVIPIGKTFVSKNSLADWNTPGDIENWSLSGIDLDEVAGGYLCVTNHGDGNITKNNTAGLPAIDLDSSDNKIIQIRMRNTGSDTGKQLYYGTSATPGISGARALLFKGGTLNQDGNFHIYQFDMRNQSAWASTLNDLRFDPASIDPSYIEIDYIHVGTIIPEPATLGLLCLLGWAFLRKK